MDSRDEHHVARAMVRGAKLADLHPEAVDFVGQVIRGEVRAAARTRLAACREVLDRSEPKPSSTTPLLSPQGQGTIVIRWDTSAPEIPPASARTALSSTSSAGSNGSTASSAIAAGERPPSA